jgi:hypothetical protein
MGRKKALAAVEAALIVALLLILLLPACRREQEPLDRNRAPETYLTSSPMETTATDYRVRMYWHGTDEDGIVERYMWYISDTLLTLDPDRFPDSEQRDWNPAQRIADYLRGRFTTKTDTVFIFKGFDDRNLAQINRQAFHIVAIDDGGRIDESPARIQFLARVRGIPEVQFWLNYGGDDKPYVPNALDTISMFTPFTVRFFATTINNVITGYRWSYGGTVYPDYNNDGSPDWLVPESQDQIVSIPLSNTREDRLPSGTFNFKVVARDEAGALSTSDILSGEGVCRVVINHDPDSEILYGDCLYTPQSSGVLESLTVYFNDGIPDTLPYNSLLRMRYRGWDDPDDELEFTNPPLPIRFQFQYQRWGYDEYGARVAEKFSSWYPLKIPEDTNPNADVEDSDRDVDSTTLRIGSFNYRFFVRSHDEQDRPDGTPAVVFFVGNFPPAIDSVRAGFYDQAAPTLFRPATNDTIIIGWMGSLRASRGDTICPHNITVVPFVSVTKHFRFCIRAGGHDDLRDPIGSGIKGWRYTFTNPILDLDYYKEGEWQFDKPLNDLKQELVFSITVPYKSNLPDALIQADSLIANPPGFLGLNYFRISAMDVKDTETFTEGIRGISPTFDEEGNVIPANNWITNMYYFANYARRVHQSGVVYLKIVK